MRILLALLHCCVVRDKPSSILAPVAERPQEAGGPLEMRVMGGWSPGYRYYGPGYYRPFLATGAAIRTIGTE